MIFSRRQTVKRAKAYILAQQIRLSFNFPNMFQRQNRQAFPARNIILLAIVVLGFLIYLLKKTREMPESNPQGIEIEGVEKRDSGLLPFESYYAMRDYPQFRPDVQTYVDALYDAHRIEVAARPRGGNEGLLAPWTLQGPGNIGARINTIAIDP